MTSSATTPKTYKVVGTSPIRHDGVDKVTGRAVYGADMNLPGLLYGKVLRGPVGPVSAPAPPSHAGSGRRHGRCWPGPRAAGHGQQRVIARAPV